MPRKKQPVRFKEGDRVCKKPNMTLFGAAANGLNKLPKIHHGVVKAIIYKKNARGAVHPYAQVLWDHTCAVDVFAVNRLVHEHEKDQMLGDHVEAIGW